MKHLPFRWLLLGMLGLVACTPETVEPVYEVPANIQSYIDLFEQEAAARGLALDIDNLRVVFEGDLNDGTAAGLCTFPQAGEPPFIRLDTTSSNWQNNLFSRETLVFHELGHCVLDIRGHRDRRLPNENYASLMRTSGEQVYGGLLTGFKRDYYLDELFDENAPAPAWAENQPAFGSVTQADKTPIFIEEFVDNRRSWNTGSNAQVESRVENGVYYFESKQENTALFTSRDIPFDETRDFEIEVRMRVVSGESFSLMQWGGSGSENFYFWGFNAEQTSIAGNWTEGAAVIHERESILPNDFNTLTLRRQGDFYHLYLNGEYYDIFSFESFFGEDFALYAGPATAIEVDYIRFNYLNG